jgi:hypothetical protein
MPLGVIRFDRARGKLEHKKVPDRIPVEFPSLTSVFEPTA